MSSESIKLTWIDFPGERNGPRAGRYILIDPLVQLIMETKINGWTAEEQIDIIFEQLRKAQNDTSSF